MQRAKHRDLLENLLRLAGRLVFPSVREFGGGVVFEALAVGAVPVVVDFGGLGDIVHPEVGRKVSLSDEGDVVSKMERILAGLAQDRDLLDRLRQQDDADRRKDYWGTATRFVGGIGVPVPCVSGCG